MEKTDEEFMPPCVDCGGRCCDYVAIEIDRPKTKQDYDHIRWYLTHKDVNIFVDHDNAWHVEFRTQCEYMDEGSRCTIYEKRPKICRDHGNEDGECEYFDTPYKLFISTLDEFEKYLDKHRIDWKFKRL